MVYVKWFLIYLLNILLFVTLPIATPLIALFTKEMEYKKDGSYTWGWLWGTYDNPPQGDRGFVTKRAFFPNCTTGWKGYVNRIQWMWRNKLYGLDKYTGIKYSKDYRIEVEGDQTISDKYKRPGSYTVKLFDGNKLIGFEYYLIKPWSETRDIRVRVGWKILTDKFERFGFAPHVGTMNPFDGYGDE